MHTQPPHNTGTNPKKMKRALALLLGGGLGLARAVELPFKTCGEDKLGVERIEASEYPLKPNDPVSLSVAFAPKVGFGLL